MLRVQSRPSSRLPRPHRLGEPRNHPRRGPICLGTPTAYPLHFPSRSPPLLPMEPPFSLSSPASTAEDRSLIPGLPDDVALLCLLRVGKPDHASCRMVCVRWRTTFGSRGFQEKRRQLGLLQPTLVVRVSSRGSQACRWYALTCRPPLPPADELECAAVARRDRGREGRAESSGCFILDDEGEGEAGAACTVYAEDIHRRWAEEGGEHEACPLSLRSGEDGGAEATEGTGAVGRASVGMGSSGEGELCSSNAARGERMDARKAGVADMCRNKEDDRLDANEAGEGASDREREQELRAKGSKIDSAVSISGEGCPSGWNPPLQEKQEAGLLASMVGGSTAYGCLWSGCPSSRGTPAISGQPGNAGSRVISTPSTEACAGHPRHTLGLLRLPDPPFNNSTAESGGQSVVVSHGDIFILGGMMGHCRATREVYRFFTWEERWVKGPSMIHPRAYFGCWALEKGDIMVAGGSSHDFRELRSVEVYSAASRRWREGPRLPSEITRFDCATWQGKHLLSEGWHWPFHFSPRGFVMDPSRGATWHPMETGLCEGWMGPTFSLGGHLMTITERQSGTYELSLYQSVPATWTPIEDSELPTRLQPPWATCTYGTHLYVVGRGVTVSVATLRRELQDTQGTPPGKADSGSSGNPDSGRPSGGVPRVLWSSPVGSRAMEDWAPDFCHLVPM